MGIETKPQGPQSFQDIMRARGVDVEGAQRRREMEESGCGVRTLESLLGVRATDQEWDLRLSEIRRSESGRSLQDLVDHLPSEASDQQRYAAAKTYVDNNLFLTDFRRQVAAHDTPLGSALRKADIRNAFKTVNEIEEMINSGQKVAAVCRIDGTPHIAHIDKVDGRLVMKSDGGIPFVPGAHEGKTAVLVVSPKK